MTDNIEARLRVYADRADFRRDQLVKERRGGAVYDPLLREYTEDVTWLLSLVRDLQAQVKMGKVAETDSPQGQERQSPGDPQGRPSPATPPSPEILARLP